MHGGFCIRRRNSQAEQDVTEGPIAYVRAVLFGWLTLTSYLLPLSVLRTLFSLSSRDPSACCCRPLVGDCTCSHVRCTSSGCATVAPSSVGGVGGFTDSSCSCYQYAPRAPSIISRRRLWHHHGEPLPGDQSWYWLLIRRSDILFIPPLSQTVQYLRVIISGREWKRHL